MKIAFIFLNGYMNYKNEFYKNILKNEKYIYCADGGTKYALFLDLVPLEVWGDMDSLQYEYLERAKLLGSDIIKFNHDKDFTDGELVISEISKRNFDRIYILGGLGGRHDHLLTNLNLLFKYENVYFIDENEVIFRVQEDMLIKNQLNKTISFIPMSDEITNLSLDGFQYPLSNFLLKRGDSICNSNVITSETAQINFTSGKLLCIIQN